MASPEKDLQDLLRLLTTTRRLPILQAMTQVKALQAAGLRSIRDIADAAPATVKDAVGDAGKSLQASCKAAVKKGSSSGSKRAASSVESDAKRAKSEGRLFGAAPLLTPAELEQSLALPVVVADAAADADDDDAEARIARTVIVTNRAPLVLAFAVELLRYTMPEQPVSSRLSLAQAVVSANSRTKAISLGIERGGNVDDDEGGWGAGQPRIRIMGREISVLKRSGYTWKGEEEVSLGGVTNGEAVGLVDGPAEPTHQPAPSTPTPAPAPTTATPTGWSVSQTITLKGSTFVARAITMTDAGQRAALMRSLFERHPQLQTAEHNAWAYRVRGTGSFASSVRQDCYDDGETACGDLMLRVMTDVGAVDTLVVLTRWFGGTMLGPDRFRLMRNCVTGVLSERLRLSGAAVTLSGEAAWGLDLSRDKDKDRSKDSSRDRTGPTSDWTDVGMPIHRPEGARQYLLKSFASPDDDDAANAAAKKKKTLKQLDAEREANLGLLLGALRLLYDSWADHVTPAELDRRAWGWYVAVRPDVDAGPAGWGAKGHVRLQAILDLRRPAVVPAAVPTT